MSADNYYLICQHTDGRFYVTCEFMSDEHESSSAAAIASGATRWFGTEKDAVAYADGEYSEYGVLHNKGHGFDWSDEPTWAPIIEQAAFIIGSDYRNPGVVAAALTFQAQLIAELKARIAVLSTEVPVPSPSNAEPAGVA